MQFPSEAAAQAHWQQLLPRDARIDVLLTHGPPHGYGDTTKGRHVGDKVRERPECWLRCPLAGLPAQHTTPPGASTPLFLPVALLLLLLIQSLTLW